MLITTSVQGTYILQSCLVKSLKTKMTHVYEALSPIQVETGLVQGRVGWVGSSEARSLGLITFYKNC